MESVYRNLGLWEESKDFINEIVKLHVRLAKVKVKPILRIKPFFGLGFSNNGRTR